MSTEQQILQLIEVIAGELFEQGHSDGLDAPVVWNEGLNPDLISIDGEINLRALAVAILERR